MLISNFLSTKFSSFSCTYWHILADSKTGAYPAAYHGGCPLVDTLRILGLLCVAIPLLPRLYRIQMYLHLHLHLLGIATHRIALGQQWDASCSGNWKTVNRLKVALLIFPVQKESDSKGGGGTVRGRSGGSRKLCRLPSLCIWWPFSIYWRCHCRKTNVGEVRPCGGICMCGTCVSHTLKKKTWIAIIAVKVI